MRLAPFALAALAGCASSHGASDRATRSERVAEAVVDAAASPAEIKRAPAWAREDDREPREERARNPLRREFVIMEIDTPRPGMPVEVDGQPVGRSHEGAGGRGLIRVRVLEGSHSVKVDGRDVTMEASGFGEGFPEAR